MREILLTLGLLLGNAFAQRDNDFPTGPSGIDSATVAEMTHIEGEIHVHTVYVGFNPYAPAFYPNQIVAQPDDKIMFIFHSGNHSVIQSRYRWPCQSTKAIDGQEGFHSGISGSCWNLSSADNDYRLFPNR